MDMVGKWKNEPCNGVDEVVNHFWVLTATALSRPWTWQISSFHLHALRPIETEQELSFSLVTPFVNMSARFWLV